MTSTIDYQRRRGAARTVSGRCATCGASFATGEACRSRGGRELDRRHWGRPAQEAAWLAQQRRLAAQAQHRVDQAEQHAALAAEYADEYSRRYR